MFSMLFSYIIDLHFINTFQQIEHFPFDFVSD